MSYILIKPHEQLQIYVSSTMNRALGFIETPDWQSDQFFCLLITKVAGLIPTQMDAKGALKLHRESNYLFHRP